MVDLADAGRRALEMLAGGFQQQPWRDGHCDEKREEHRHRGVCRDRAHVGAHHARNEHHQQQRDNNGQRHDDRRIADFGNRFDRRLDQAALSSYLPMADDVLDDDDGVIDQNADGKDQREKAHAVDRIAEHPRGKHCQQNCRRNDDENNQSRVHRLRLDRLS